MRLRADRGTTRLVFSNMRGLFAPAGLSIGKTEVDIRRLENVRVKNSLLVCLFFFSLSFSGDLPLKWFEVMSYEDGCRSTWGWECVVANRVKISCFLFDSPLKWFEVMSYEDGCRSTWD